MTLRLPLFILLPAVLIACSSGDDKPEITAPPSTSTPPPSQTVTPLGPCERVLQPITVNPVTSERLNAAVNKMLEVRNAAVAGDFAAAEAAFAGDTHDITHDIDAPLRDADLGLAYRLCLAVTELEKQIGGVRELAIISMQAGAAARLLQEAGPMLGLTQ